MNVGIALGANLGDKVATLNRAVDFMKKWDSDLKVSSWYSSIPVDCPKGAPDFVNGMLEMVYKGDLMDLLDQLQAYERAEGRETVRVVNAPRQLDLDMIYADDQVVDTERLTLPHPRAMERLFVLQPMAEISPDRILPGTQQSVRQLCDELMKTNEELICHKVS